MMAPDSSPDWETIARYLCGETNAAESEVVRAWLEANPADAALVRATRELPADAVPVTSAETEAALARMHQRMREDAPSRHSRPAAFVGRARRGLYIGAALAAAAALVLITGLRLNRTGRTTAHAAQTYATTVGQRDSVHLPDGTRIILGPQTTLTVPADYATGARAVALNGAAYFDVHHDARRPFSVTTANARVDDIGTSFTVESGPGVATTVGVTAGRVRLGFSPAVDRVASVVLAPGDRGTVDVSGRESVEHGVVGAEDLAWTRGRLVFRDATVARVSMELTRWYGVHIEADSAFFARHVTASFNGESIDQVLHVLGLTLGVTIEHRGTSAVVVPARDAVAP